VLGAFKATPIRQLETKAYVPPPDLCLNGKIAHFQARLERAGLARQIRNACTAIRTVLRTRNRRRDPLATPGTTRKAWAEQWIGRPIEQLDEREKSKILSDWIARWTEEQ
jgi:hypothetical protein